LGRINENKEEIKKEITKTCDKWKGLISECVQKEKEITKDKSFIDVEEEISGYLGELEKINELSPEKIQKLYSNVKKSENKYKALRNTLNGYIAKEVIKKLSETESIDQIKEVLESNELKKHIEYVDEEKFEKKYRQYTKKGSMVFYERGDEWKIIVIKGALEDPKNLEMLQEQLEHEFRHVAFENNEETKEDYRKLLTKNKEQWEEIRKTFKKAYSSKEAPDKMEWQDDDILSELYAMKTGGELREEKSLKDKLNNLVYVAAGLGAQKINNIKKAYQEESVSDAIIRGFDSNKDDDDNDEKSKDKPKEDKKTDKSNSESENEINISKESLDKINKIDDEIESYLKSGELKYAPGVAGLLKLMQKYNQKTKNEIVIESIIKSRIDKVGKDLKEVEGEIIKISKSMKNEGMNPFRNLWNKTSFVGISDFVGTLNQAAEFFKRRHTRKEADNAAKIGMALFGNTDLGNEATANQLKAEEDEVSKWEGDYSSMDATQLQGKLDNMAKASAIDPSPDQLKAILRVQAKNGNINWRDESLWKVLNKLQDASELKPGDAILLNNPTILRQKLHRAMSDIWDKDEFLNLENSNESSYESSKKDFKGPIDLMGGELNKLLREKIEMKRKGEYFDAAEFEAILEYAFEMGKAHPKELFFYTLVGLAEGVLTPERSQKLGNLMSNVPVMEWLQIHKAEMNPRDLKNYCNSYFGDEAEKLKPGKNFRNFYRVFVENDERVIDRIIQNTLPDRKNWDKDSVGAFAHMGGAEQAVTFLNGGSGQKTIKPAALANVYVGALEYMEENVTALEGTNFRENFTRQASWLMATDAIVENRAKVGDKLFIRTSYDLENKKPSEGRLSNHENWTLSQHRGKIDKFMRALDEDLFNLLRERPENQSKKDKEEGKLPSNVQNVVDHLKHNYSAHTSEWNNIKTMENVFDQSDIIMKCAVDQYDDTELKKRITETLSI